MRNDLIFDPNMSPEELRGFSRTLAEIEWLLLAVVLLYQRVLVTDQESSAAVSLATCFFAAFVLGFHYLNFYRKETRWKIALETWFMIVFITWVLTYTGRLESPLINLYLLVIIASALALGKSATFLEILLITACYLWLGYPERNRMLTLSSYTSVFAAQLAPVVLVAYVTTMLSADIRRALTQIRSLSETDELTGIYNRRAFTTISEQVFKQALRYARPLSVLMIDSDSLKTVNDAYGHDAGNRLLKLTVQCIQSQLRDADFVVRYGGDEFVVLLPETPCGGAVHVANRIRHGVESTPLATKGKKVRTSVSIGIASFPDHGDNLDDVLKIADEAMYMSKTDGRNRVTVYKAKGLPVGEAHQA
ncbi:MAG: GGDEF domain-containing protein [Thiobacillaceae bacterium]